MDLVGFPSILKTRRLGYDGKGQARLERPDQAGDAWREVGEVPSILEALVPFDRELSILGARGRDGGRRVLSARRERPPRRDPPHVHARADPSRAALRSKAEELALAVMVRLGHVGVLAIELFETGEGLLGNEMAPRVHNSGHWTIEGAATSQFENHLRAVCRHGARPDDPNGLQRDGEPDRFGASGRGVPGTVPACTCTATASTPARVGSSAT